MRAFLLAAFAAVFIVASAAIAYAADVPGAVSIPWGDFVAYVLPAVALAVTGGVLWGIKQIAPALYALLRTAQFEQLIANARNFGINSVSGAVKGKQLTVPIANDVVREMVDYMLNHGPKWLEQFAGTPMELAEKAYARLDTVAEASKPDFAAILADPGGKVNPVI